jgi:DNA-binding transcriptional regulator PaaX
MRRITSYRLTLGEAAIAILGELATATAEIFFPHPYYHQFCAHAQRRSFQRALKRLERKHLVGTRMKDGREEWHLTGSGEELARRLRLRFTFTGQKKRWDGKWRLVLFDIPERIRGRRDFLRKELEDLGFHQLQKSVCLTPYSLPGDFLEPISELARGRNFRIVTADGIRDDDDLRKVFFPSV